MVVLVVVMVVVVRRWDPRGAAGVPLSCYCCCKRVLVYINPPGTAGSGCVVETGTSLGKRPFRKTSGKDVVLADVALLWPFKAYSVCSSGGICFRRVLYITAPANPGVNQNG